MRYGSLFSGAGGFELGLNKLGWECRWMCEVDPYPQSVLRYHWPKTTLYADVTKMKGFAIEPVDVIVGGFPCQSFSVAGKKKGDGLEIFHHFVRVVDEMRKVTDGEYPRAVIWENVPGILNKSKDWISSVYTAWGEIGALVQEHRVVDAKYFGVPQRRRRVIGVVVFDPRADCGQEILSDTDSLSRYLEASRRPRPDITGAIKRSIADCGEPPTVINSWYKGAGNTQVETGILVPFDKTQITNPDNRSNPQDGDVMHTLSASAKPPHIAYTPNMTGTILSKEGRRISEPEAKLVANKLGVRKLTPLECERLMGWPDEWTAYGYGGKKISDTRRYMMCGNGLVAPVATWAGARLEQLWK